MSADRYDSLPAGEYFVGDPCYAIPNDEWDAFLNEGFFPAEDAEQNVFEYKGMKVFAHYTKYGDGSYLGSDDRRYAVDSGSIGAVPIELCGKYSREELERLGRIMKYDATFFVDYDEGLFTIGDVDIDTDPSWGDEDYEVEEDDYDDQE